MKGKVKKQKESDYSQMWEENCKKLEKIEEKAEGTFKYLQDARRQITKDQLRVNVQRRKLDALYKKVHRELEATRKTNEEFLDMISSAFQKAMFAIHQGNQKIESFEDSLLHILHNIKRNQFLYAHYPEDWVKSYHDLKEGLEEENKHLEAQGAI